MAERVTTLLIDNYDSFTFNLFQLIAEVNGDEPIVVRNDGATWSELANLDFDNIVISPGPGSPERPSDFGVCADAINEAAVPLLGVCLGHQGLGYLCGAPVVHAPEVMHGRLSEVYHDDSELFVGIPQGFAAVRYHSLCVGLPLPDDLEVTAWTADGVIMALRHRRRPAWGVQFHPESICTSNGKRLVENFRDLTKALRPEARPASRGRAPSVASIVPRRAGSAEPEQPRALDLKVRVLDRTYDPERCFVHLFGGDPHAFWLDSSRANDQQSRFSFMGGSDGPLSTLVRYDVRRQEVRVVGDGSTTCKRETIFDYLGRELRHLSKVPCDLPFDFNCGFVGYFGYELKADCGGSVVHRSSMPDAAFLFADRVLAFDHVDGRTYVLCLTDATTGREGEAWLEEMTGRLETLPTLTPLGAVVGDRDDQGIGFRLSRSRDTYLADIERCKGCLVEGESYEICLTNKVNVDVGLDPLRLYRILRHVNPAPFAAFLRFGNAAVCCSSPERFLRIHRDRWVETKPIKGTVGRGKTPEEDFSLSEWLRTSEKNRAENLMITDLLRNDLGMVCEVGSVHVPYLMAIETYETVHHMVSTIRGRLRVDLGAADCIRACFPGGSMTGAPKIRTMEIIDTLEQEARGVYSGAIGYLGLCGGADLNIVIRTIVMDGQSASIGTGGAIVMQSEAEDEFQETLLKAKAPLRAISLAVNGEATTLPVTAPAQDLAAGRRRGVASRA
jgi:para-aminobenzoate synthetase